MRGLHSVFATTAAGLILVACGGAASPTPASDEPTPFVMTAQSITALPSSDGLPGYLNGFELIAAKAGTASYSGFTCVIAPEAVNANSPGCACQEAVILQSTFTFREDQHMVYHFEGDSFSSQWEMKRNGSNWEYTFPFIYEAGGNSTTGAMVVLLEFEEFGYRITQGANLQGSGFATCPNVDFVRLNQ